MVETLGHRHRLVTGGVVDLLDGDGDLQLVGGGASVSFEHQEIHPPGSSGMTSLICPTDGETIS